MTGTQHADDDSIRFQRRRFLTIASWTAAGAIGVLKFSRALAAALPEWPKVAFSQHNEAAALKALYDKTPSPSKKVSLSVPEIAENGAVVPVSVDSTLPNVTSIAIFVPNNPFTLAASYVLPQGALPSVSCRLKMAKTSDVMAVVESNGKLYSTKKQVKVTLGGCGG